ncbi:methionine ABC transporter substrate-binding lipoprotein MetQ [Moritella marina]|uniref:methionine ABC transporter substrate-binding lipoprotein MetQ n=1 Tax=Moritella marina TaxID=90736 RepID=UPI003704C6D9
MEFSLKKLVSVTAIASSVLLSACSGDKDSTVLKVGAMAGPEAEVVEIAKNIAKEKYNLDIEIVTFTDYVTPNRALEEGSIDVNAFQHKPYLDAQIEQRGYDITAVANTFVYPIAAYSTSIKTVDELKDGDKVAVPNDPTNLGRSLLLLEQQGIIALKPGIGIKATELDITANPFGVEIVKLEAALLARNLQDVTIAVINTTFATKIGLSPTKDGIFVENKESPYVNLIVARNDNKDSEKVKQFITAFQTQEVYDEAKKLFNNAIVKGW